MKHPIAKAVGRFVFMGALWARGGNGNLTKVVTWSYGFKSRRVHQRHPPTTAVPRGAVVCLSMSFSNRTFADMHRYGYKNDDSDES